MFLLFLLLQFYHLLEYQIDILLMVSPELFLTLA